MEGVNHFTPADEEMENRWPIHHVNMPKLEMIMLTYHVSEKRTLTDSFRSFCGKLLTKQPVVEHQAVELALLSIQTGGHARAKTQVRDDTLLITECRDTC